MKNVFLLFIALIVILSIRINISLAGNSGPSDPSNLADHTASSPSLPGLPQEDDFLCGDVNEDGFINVLDIISMVNYIMGGNPSPFDQEAADINADDGINVLDIIGIVNIIMQVQGLPCGCMAPVTYEGKTYSTVQIGDQCWFRENLNVGTKINSTVGGFQQTDNGVIEKYCYENNTSNCDIYGGLYEWAEAMQYITTDGAQGICPAGWHIPMDGEYTSLSDNLDGVAIAGGKMKSIGTLEDGSGHWHEPNSGATNESGFAGHPGGSRRNYDGTFGYMGFSGTFWASTQGDDSEKAWSRTLSYNNTNLSRISPNRKENGYSIRCLKGCEPQPTQADAGADQLDVSGTSTTLAGNTPTSGTGLWAIVSGIGGTIINPANPTSAFQGMAGNTYTLTWNISTICNSSVDTVLISFGPGFSCGDLLIDDRDGQSYPTVLIDTLCWMAENLNVGIVIISTTGGFHQSDNGIIEKYCYNNDPAQCAIYGGLYEWTEAMQYVTSEGSQGICPVGWLIPTDNQWKILEGTVDTQYPVGDPEWDQIGHDRGYDAGGNLKETGTAHWNPPNTGGTNSSGFTALPGGYRYNLNGHFLYLGENAHFWTSTQSSSNAYERVLYYGHSYIGRYPWWGQDYGFSVRCIKGCDLLPTQADAGPDQLNLVDTSAILAGNTPAFGTGVWHIVSGTGGIIDDTLCPTSGFHGLDGNIYALTWTISTVCGSSVDAVAISFGTDFTCGDLLIDDRDGQSYTTVPVDTQCVMGENLNIGTMIISGTGGLQTDNGIIEKYCQANDVSNCDIYGGLYEWNEAMQYTTTEGAQGICPAGWHIPSDEEFTLLTYFLGGTGVAGGKMKSTGTLEEGTGLWYEPNTGATNESGLTGLPGGYRLFNSGLLIHLGVSANFWSSTENYPDWAWLLYLWYENEYSHRDYGVKESGLSVRCLKDE